ncbi:uncharacterized protein LAESUDRAFT_645649 [Laetiporus sulphureus 93-53]|uniref:Zn(2)-C6 fungal-type domain-containing protein n=1 Tax=Laetiporus sulphureus 93-53 TaxID=1314785 RepID=A0A165GAD9_9APHY|nr:uncharacterized protein LAESUDRAFT_645649 [Laetiporus sulphureus 93-53]KZT10066.1 hypothetical protein LAESUDRAFT_645649 [Laetiporus sulphureus 93-53]
MPSTHPLIASDDASRPNNLSPTLSFVKGGKRKRLSKACDACHKSKRRCDGTAPCSNCYFASKTCTYTDSSGRPVPAPRSAHTERQVVAGSDIPTLRQTFEPAHSPTAMPVPPQLPPAERIAAVKKSRAAGSSTTSPTSTSASSPTLEQVTPPRSQLLSEPDTTNELVNLFFGHCNPHRMILHKPSFSSALSHYALPEYLVLAVCAVAAPLHKSVSARAAHARIAGVPFYNEAVALMFDNAGRLLSEPTVATAQALCLMEMHEVAASHSWTKHYKYFDLALRLLEESLEVHKPDDEVQHTPSSPSVDLYIERECARRCFWLIQVMGWINGIYTYRPMRPRSVQLMESIRLPVDETTFELAAHWSAATKEFLHAPAPRTRYASQFGHVCRILSIYANVQAVVAMSESEQRATALRESTRTLNAWIQSLPAHLRFSEENVEKQEEMFGMSSNTGAWCFFFMHALYPCCYLAVLEGEGRLGEPIPWVRDRLGTIFKATGTRAKNTILSACVLWSYSKYHPDDEQLHRWDRDFERVWGFSVTVVANQWRQAQTLERAQAAASKASANPSQRDAVPPASTDYNGSQPGGTIETQAHGDTGAERRADGASTQTSNARASTGASNQRNAFPADAEQIVQAPLLRSGTNLPSLKASGLLDSWKPPSEAFASALSLSGQAPPARENDRNAVAVSTLLNPEAQPVRTNAVAASMMPVGLDWLENEV